MAAVVVATRGARVLDIARRWGGVVERSPVVVAKKKMVAAVPTKPIQSAVAPRLRENPSWQYQRASDGVWIDFSEAACQLIDRAFVQRLEVIQLPTEIDDSGREVKPFLALREPLDSPEPIITRRVGLRSCAVRRLGTKPFREPRRIESCCYCCATTDLHRSLTLEAAQSFDAEQGSQLLEEGRVTLDQLPSDVLAMIFAFAVFDVNSPGSFNGYTAARTLCTLELVCKRFGAHDRAIGGISATELAAFAVCQTTMIPALCVQPYTGRAPSRNWKETMLWRDFKTVQREKELRNQLHRLAFTANQTTAIPADRQARVRAAAVLEIRRRWGDVDQKLVERAQLGEI